MAIVDELFALLGYKIEGEENLKKFNSSLDNLEKKAYAVGQALGRTAAIAGTAIAGGMFLLGKSVLDTSAKFETYLATLETIEGSAEGAQAAMDWVSKFAKTTPYEVDELTRAFVKLRSYGLDPMDGSMNVLGDTAAGMGKRIDQVVEAYADASTFQFERLRELGIVASQEGDKVTFNWTENGKSMSRQFGKTSAEVQKALTEIWGKKFQGAMLRQSTTWTGMMSNLGDSWVDFQRRIGDAGFFDTVKDKLAGVLDLVAEWDENGTIDRVAGVLSTTFIAIADTIGNVINRIAAHIAFLNANWETLEPWINVIKFAFMGLIATAFPLVTAFVLLALVVDDFLTYMEGGDSIIGNFVEWLRGIIPVAGEVEDAIVNMALGIMAGLGVAFLLAPKMMTGLLLRGLGMMLAGVGAAIAPMLAPVGAAISGAFAGLGPLLLAGLRIAFGVLTGPVGWALLAVSAGLLMYQFWDEIVATWNIVSANAQALFAQAANWFASMDFMGQGIALLDSLWQGIQTAWAGISANTQALFSQITTWFSGIDWGQVGHDAAYTLVSGLLWMIFASATTVGNAFKFVIDAIKAIDWAGVGTWIKDAVVNSLTTIGTQIQAAFVNAWALVSGIDWGAVGRNAVDAIVAYFRGLGALMLGAIQGSGQAISDEIKAWFNVDLSAIGAQVASTLLAGLQSFGDQIRNWWMGLFSWMPSVPGFNGGAPMGSTAPAPANTAVGYGQAMNDNYNSAIANFLNNSDRVNAGQSGAPVVTDNSQQHANQTNNVTVSQTVQQATDAPAAAANATAAAVTQAAPQPPRMNKGAF